MIPGSVSSLSEYYVESADTIRPTSDIVLLTGMTSIATIIPPGKGFGTILFLIPTEGDIDILDTGNIFYGGVMSDQVMYIFIYSRSTGKWHSNNLA